jgi:hypothetical protein
MSDAITHPGEPTQAEVHGPGLMTFLFIFVCGFASAEFYERVLPALWHLVQWLVS